MTPEPVDPSDDELARQLRGVPPEPMAPSSDASFREALFRRSASLVRRRLLLRHLAAAAALLLAYGAGIATARLAERGVEPARPAPQLPAAAPDIALEPAAPAPQLVAADPRELEERALASPRERRVELLKLAGDRYLGERQEVDAALRCYRGALSLMPREERASISSNETWLFAALKSSRS